MEIVLKSKVEKTEDNFVLIYHVTDERITLGWRKEIQGLFFGDYITLDSETEYDVARDIVLEDGRACEKRLLGEPDTLRKARIEQLKKMHTLPEECDGPYFISKGLKYYIKRGDEI